eukprot:350061-Chlamydomonas_euryale.AAC.2
MALGARAGGDAGGDIHAAVGDAKQELSCGGVFVRLYLKDPGYPLKAGLLIPAPQGIGVVLFACTSRHRGGFVCLHLEASRWFCLLAPRGIAVVLFACTSRHRGGSVCLHLEALRWFCLLVPRGIGVVLFACTSRHLGGSVRSEAMGCSRTCAEAMGCSRTCAEAMHAHAMASTSTSKATCQASSLPLPYTLSMIPFS